VSRGPIKKRVVLTRRQVLRGTVGIALALPLLPSIGPGRAWAQDVSLQRRPRFVSITSNHGGLLESEMFPSESLLTETTTLYPGLDIRRGDLQRSVDAADGSEASLSPILTGDANLLTDQLTSKINVLWGLDIPFYIAHHTGGHLGNYARNDGNGADGQAVQQQHMPTIDQLMAWSPSFYDSLSGVSERTLIAGRNGFSWGYSNPSAGEGEIQEVRGVRSAYDLFQRAFPGGVSVDEPTRPPIVDRVMEAYRSLREGNRRLSSDDRQRLDDHMDRLAELERRLTTVNAACQDVSQPEQGVDLQDPLRNYDDLADTVAAAMICGASRIAVLGISEEEYVPFAGDWHQDVAHQHQLPEAQQQLQEANNGLFRRVFLRLAAALDGVEESPGESVLDNTLIAWSQESGAVTHEARAIPVVTAGSAAGFFRTGQFVDYRNRTPRGLRRSEDDSEDFTGLLYNQWLATCLQAMGLPPDEWQAVPNNAPTGYGLGLVDEGYASTHVAGVVDNASDILPLLRAT
jgi:hypothetical protein